MMKKGGVLSALAFVLFWCATASAQLTAGMVGGQGALAIELKIPGNVGFAWVKMQEGASLAAPREVRVEERCTAPESLTDTFGTQAREIRSSFSNVREGHAQKVLVTGLPSSLIAKWKGPDAPVNALVPTPFGVTHLLRFSEAEDGSRVEGVFLDLLPGTYSFEGFGINTESGVRWWVEPFVVTVDINTVKHVVRLQAKILTDFIPGVAIWNDVLCFGTNTKECLDAKEFKPGLETKVVQQRHTPLRHQPAPAFRFEGCTQVAQLEFLETPGVVEQYAGYVSQVQCTKEGDQDKVRVVRGQNVRPVVAVYAQTLTIDPKSGKQTRGKVQTHTLRIGDSFRISANTFYAFETRPQCLKVFNKTPEILDNVSPTKPAGPAPKDKKSEPKKVRKGNGPIVPAAP